MRDLEKLKEEMDERNRKILDVAFELFVDKKIEAVSMGRHCLRFWLPCNIPILLVSV